MGKFKYEKYDYSKVGICETKKWPSVYTVETLSDINAFHNNSAEAELTRILSEQIANQVNMNILSNITGTFTTSGPRYSATYISNIPDFNNVYSNVGI